MTKQLTLGGSSAEVLSEARQRNNGQRGKSGEGLGQCVGSVRAAGGTFPKKSASADLRGAHSASAAPKSGRALEHMVASI